MRGMPPLVGTIHTLYGDWIPRPCSPRKTSSPPQRDYTLFCGECWITRLAGVLLIVGIGSPRGSDFKALEPRDLPAMTLAEDDMLVVGVLGGDGGGIELGAVGL